MRRRLVLAGAGALGLVLPWLSFAPAVAAPPASSNVPLVYRYVAAWNLHDVARAVELFADDVVYYDASIGTPMEGKDAAADSVVANFINAAPDLVWGIRGTPVADGNRVAFEWQFSGTNSGAWADGTAPTHRHFTFTGATVMEIRNGLITRQSDYYDALGFYKQLGWL